MVKRFYRHAALQQKYYPGSRKIARLHDEMAGRLVLPANLLDELPAGDDRSDQFENCLDDDSHIESSSPAGGPCPFFVSAPLSALVLRPFLGGGPPGAFASSSVFVVSMRVVT